MTAQEFCEKHPRIYHMATSQAMHTIRRHGLLSTIAILKLLEVDEESSRTLITKRRPQMTKLEHKELGTFYLRDQKPLRDAALEVCLNDMKISEWYETLNSRVFFWASRDRVDRLLGARAYRTSDQLVLTFDTEPFVNKYWSKIEVSTINSGATLFKPVRRGRNTFIALRDFADNRSAKPIVEVTVPGGVPDIAEFILGAELREGVR